MHLYQGQELHFWLQVMSLDWCYLGGKGVTGTSNQVLSS